MYWLPVVVWGLFFGAVLFYAVISIARDRYYGKAEQAQLCDQEIPKEPWYVRNEWDKYFNR